MTILPSTHAHRDKCWALTRSAELQASAGATATVICSTHSQTAGLSFDQLCRSAVQSSCHSQAEVHDAVSQCLAQYQEPTGYGVVLLLLSVLATHTVRYDYLDVKQACMLVLRCKRSLMLTCRIVTHRVSFKIC